MRFFSFTKTDRLLKGREYLELSRVGQRTHNRHFVAVFSPGRFERTRLGITVKKKVGHAVSRNRIKRFSREFFRLNRHNITGHWDINIIAKEEAASLSSDQAFLSLQDIFNRISNSRDNEKIFC